MNNLRKRISFLLIISVLIAAFTQLHAQEGEKMERFRDEKMKFFNEKLELSEEVAVIFWPIYQDLHNRKMKLGEEERTLITYYKSNAEFMTDKEIDETIEGYFSLQKMRLDLDIQYHDKFVETIGKSKTMKMYTLEREFRLHILRKFRGGGHGPNRQGKGRGSDNK